MTIHDPLLNIKVTSSVCSFFALAATLFRLYIRRGKYWWDDGWALFSLISLLVQIAGVFMHVPNPSDLSKLNRIAAYYIIAAAFYCIIWSARLSILFSVMRIETDPDKIRQLTWISRVFIVTTLFLIAQLFWVCEPEPHWKDAVSPQCVLTKQVVICQLVTDVLSDVILMLAPLNLIRGLQDVALRRRLTLIFSTCIVTTIVSLVHAAFIFQDGGPKVLVAAFVENTVSLIVCNLPVVAAAMFRLKPSNTARDDFKPLALSTVRFGWSRSSGTGNRSRSKRSDRNLNTVDITTTVALDELRDQDTYGTQSSLSALKTIPDDYPGADGFGKSAISGAPLPVQVGHDQPSMDWGEGLKEGAPFGTDSKGPPGNLTGEKREADDDQRDPRATKDDTQSHVVFAEMPRPPR